MSETVKKHSYEFEKSLAEDPFTQIQRIFVYFLCSLFRHDQFRGTGMWWNRDEEVTEVIISSEKPVLSEVEKTPHITVIVGNSAWGGVGLDQMQSRKMEKEERKHTDLMSGFVTLHCQGKDGNQCRRLAWYCSFYINIFRRLIMRHGKLHQVNVNHSISGESAPSAYTGSLASEELVSVVVNVPFYWQPAWFIREPRDLLKRFETTLRVRAHRPRPFSLKGRPAYSIPVDQFNSFEELEAEVQGTTDLTQTVIGSE